MSRPWLLMPSLNATPIHRQPWLNYAGTMGSCLPRGRVLTTCAILALRNDRNGDIGLCFLKQIQHCCDVIMGTMASQITSLTIVYSTFIQAQIKENIKAPRHWPLCGELTGDRWIPEQMASNAENISIWIRHHDDKGLYQTWLHCDVDLTWIHRFPVSMALHIYPMLFVFTGARNFTNMI